MDKPTHFTDNHAVSMTLRDYFAAKALFAVLEQKDVHDGREYDSAAWMAYQIADAMMKARGE